MKYDIAICDDVSLDAEFLIRRIQRLAVYKEELRFHEYRSGKELLAAMKDISFSLIFMDIQMGEMDGEQAAEKIREIDDNVILVFFTGYAEPTPHSIMVHPYRFIKKNMSEKELDKSIKEALEKMEAEADFPTIKAKIGSKTIILKANEIVYIEKYSKSVRIYISKAAARKYQIELKSKSDIRASVKLKDIYEKLRSYGFGYPHDSYIINFQYIVSFTENEFRMEGYENTVFKVTRSKAVEFNRLKKEFYSEKYKGDKGKNR